MTQLPRQQINQSLQSPGLVPLTPDSAGVTQANQILQSIQGIGQVVGQIGGLAQQKTNERKAEQRDIDEALKADARFNVRKQLPELFQKIDNGELDDLFADLAEGETVSSRVEAFVSQRLSNEDGTLAVPEVVADATRRELVPILTQQIVSRHQQIIDGSRSAIKTTFQEGLVSAHNPEDIRAQLEGAKLAGGFSEDEALALLVPALRLNSQLGDSTRTNALIESLGDRFPAEQRTALANLARAQQSQRVTDAGKAQAQVIGMLNDSEPTDLIRQRIAENRAILGEPITAQLLRQADARDNQALAQSQNLFADAIRTDILLGFQDQGAIRDKVLEAIQLPQDNPQHISATIGQALIGQLKEKTQRDESADRVIARLQGGPITLTSDDGAAVMQLLTTPGPSGVPLIDANGNPTNTEALAVTLGQLDFIPADVMQRIDQGAQSGNAEDVARAAALHFTLSRIAPSALDKAGQLSETARLRLGTITARLNRESPTTLLPDGTPNPQMRQKILDEAKRVLPLTADVVNSVPEATAIKLLTNKTRAVQAEAEIDNILRESLPAFATRRTRSLFGIDSLVPDASVDTSNIPPTFREDFRERSARWFVALTNSDFTVANAREEAPRRALEELKADYIFAVADDRLHILQRHDNPQDLDWTADTEAEWKASATELNLPDDVIDDYRPATRRGELGFVFKHIDDPMNLLTDDTGQVVHFRPRTEREVARDTSELDEQRARFQRQVDENRVLRRKRNFMEWFTRNAKKKEQGQNYDVRIDAVADRVTPQNVTWMIAQQRGRHFIGDQGTVPELINVPRIELTAADIDRMLGASTGP